MAVSSEQFNLTDAAIVALNTAGPAGMHLVVKNNDNAQPVYLGGAAVAAGGGYILGKGESIPVELKPNEVLYAISTASGALVSVLRS